MRFTTVETARAYTDYLDSLDDWPPPDEAPSDQRHQTAAPESDMREETQLRLQRAAS